LGIFSCFLINFSKFFPTLSYRLLNQKPLLRSGFCEPKKFQKI